MFGDVLVLETVYSPCDGQVVNIVDGFSDNKPLNQPTYYSNYIVIKTQNAFIRMEHLKMDSIMVKIGDKVKTGQPMAKVGNSGMSDVPHLHICHDRYGKRITNNFRWKISCQEHIIPQINESRPHRPI